MPVETISYRGLTIAVDLQGDEYAAKVCRPDGSELPDVPGMQNAARRIRAKATV